MRNLAPVLMLALALGACSTADEPQAVELTVEAWPLPAAVGSAQPDLVRAPDGALLLAWLLRLEDAHALEMARYSRDGWGEVARIAEGRRWFVNWADTPHVTATPDGTLWAHWLQRSGDGPYDYGIALVNSTDDGANWNALPSVHPTDRPLDFGFVSLWADGEDRLGIAWLDSRQKTAGHAGHAHDHHGH